MISLLFLSYCMKTALEDGCVQVNEVPPALEDGCVQVNEVPPSFNLLIYGAFFPWKVHIQLPQQT